VAPAENAVGASSSGAPECSKNRTNERRISGARIEKLGDDQARRELETR
jgi:hypothetical protein